MYPPIHQSIHSFILSNYHVIGSKAIKANITGPGSWEILNKYLLNEWFVSALALLQLLFPTSGHSVLSIWQILSSIVQPTGKRGITACIKRIIQHVPYILGLRAQICLFFNPLSCYFSQFPLVYPLFDPLFGFPWLLNENSNSDCFQATWAVLT